MERGTILIVDDNPQILSIMSDLLGPLGYQIVCASGGREALDHATAAPPDLVLLDVMMPDVDGWEMLQRLQDRHGVGSIPVLMFSGKVDNAEAGEAAKRGASGFIGKPFDPQQLIESAKQMLPA
jgi:CheY-like chemotaxis protein